jgi:uracil-DNA glycosylase
MDSFQQIYKAIVNDTMNTEMTDRGYIPVYTAGPEARIVIVGQAPGSKAQATARPWNDASGVLLRKWLGISDEQIYNPQLVALLPMDCYYPGKGLHGDLPPRKGFADKWHPQLLALMPRVELIILIGAYAQKHYLGKDMKKNLTETVRAYTNYQPKFFPLVHPSPLNFRWQSKNPWFEETVVPVLRKQVQEIVNRKNPA